MTRANDPSGTPVQLPLAELMARYLHRQADAHAAGLAAVETTGKVVPFEAAPVQTVEPRLAWTEAVAAAFFRPADTDAHSWSIPTDWPALVAGQEPMHARPSRWATIRSWCGTFGRC